MSVHKVPHGYAIPVLVDDVMFSHNGANGPESKTTRMFRQVRQVAAPAAKLLSTTAC